MTSCPAGLLEPRRRVHRVTEEGYLSLESADLPGNERPRVDAGAKDRDLPMAVQETRSRRFQRLATGEETADRTRILLWGAERPGRDQCVAHIAMHLPAEV